MPKESVHKKLERVRPPRVNITYEVETGGALEVKELPFVMGVLADFSGNPIAGAVVTLTLPGLDVTDQPLVFDSDGGDFILNVNMPGAGTNVPYVIKASAPTLAQPLEKRGLLAAASN